MKKASEVMEMCKEYNNEKTEEVQVVPKGDPLNVLKPTPELIYLIEAMKTDGYWSIERREGSIQNKNLPFLAHIEDILKKHKINYQKRLLVKVKIQNFQREKVFVFQNKKEIKYHMEKSLFDNSKKIVFNLPFASHDLDIEVDGSLYPLFVTIGKEEVETTCTLLSFAYTEIRFYNLNFLKFIDKNADIELKDTTPIMSAFSALVDAEGMIIHKGAYRKINVRMIDREYLDKWSMILKQLDIGSNFGRKEKHLYVLEIFGWEDFDRLIKLGFKLIHSKKSEKFNKIMTSYVRFQISHGEAKTFYLNKLKEIGMPVTARELSTITNKGKRVVNHYLVKLETEEKLNVDKSRVVYYYSAK